MAADDREQNFERALARHLRGASPDSSCPDAEILSAYHERALSRDEMAHWKEHIAACARCQETLAVVEQTDHLSAEEWEHEHVLHPVEQIAAAPAPRSSSACSVPGSASAAAQALIPEATTAIDKGRAHLPWRWVAPVGLAAAAVIVWVGVQEIRTQRLQQLQQRATQIAENRETAPAPPLSSAAPPAERLRKAEPEAKLVSPEKPAAKPAPLVVPPKAAATAPTVSSNAPNRAPNREVSNQLIAPAPIAEAEVQPSSPVAGYIEKSESADQVAPAPAPTTRARTDLDAAKKQAENAPPPTAAETVQVQSAAPSLNKASSQVSAYQVAIDANLRSIAAADRRYILAPGEKYAWQVGNAGSIEYSADHGKTWKPQTSGVAADLTAGSAISDKVCWVVGKAGTVILTTDGGKHWKPLASPLTDDLGGVHAADAMHASIWDVSNRKSYETSDGGVTWIRTANE
jgi:Photosynthesis system II assembly factor YCF48